MKLTVNYSLSCSTGSYSAHVEDGQLHVPFRIAMLARHFSKRDDADVFIVAATSFPDTVSEYTGWTRRDVDRANQELADTLRSHLNSETHGMIRFAQMNTRTVQN